MRFFRPNVGAPSQRPDIFLSPKRDLRANGGGTNLAANGGVQERSAHHYSVDCTHANTGLFTGIFVMVLTIISLIVFFVLISSPDPALHQAAITVASMTELSLYCITTVAVLIGMCQVRKIPFERKAFSIVINVIADPFSVVRHRPQAGTGQSPPGGGSDGSLHLCCLLHHRVVLPAQ